MLYVYGVFVVFRLGDFDVVLFIFNDRGFFLFFISFVLMVYGVIRKSCEVKSDRNR